MTVARTLRRGWRGRGSLFVGAACVVACSQQPTPLEGVSAGAPQEPGVEQGRGPAGVESVVSIARVQQVGPEEIEVHLAKQDGFHVGASRPALRIGSRLFVLSRHPPNGDLKTLIFSIPSRSLADVADREPMYFARREADLPSAQQWRAGPKAWVADAARGTWFLGQLDRSSIERLERGVDKP